MKSPIRNIHAILAAAVLAWPLSSPLLHAQAPVTPEKIEVRAPETIGKFSLEEFFKQPQLAGPTISPNGKYMAATVPARGRMNLGIIDLETRKGNIITGYDDFDVREVTWIGNDRLVYTLGQANSPTGPGQFDGGGLFVIGRDGKDFRRLAPTVRESRAKGTIHRSLSFFRRIPGSTDEIVASGNMTATDSTDLYRLNLNTGKYTLMTTGRPGDYTSDWIMDKDLVPRVVTTWVRDTLTSAVYYRKDANSPWYEIARYERNKGTILIPLAIENDNKTLQVASNQGRDTMAVFRFDPETKKLGELIAQHPRYDMGANAAGDGVPGVSVDPDSEKLLGYRVQAGKPETVWLDERYASIQASLDAALPGRINNFRRLPGSKRMIVTSYSDIHPMRWYLHDQEAKTIEEIGSAQPWLEGKLIQQRLFTFKTRDGLEIPGYYFLPANYKPGTKLPTIVHIHGGPHARADTFANGFGFREGQLFAAQGYAVIVPNFRITPGLGSKLYFAGFGSFGREMSNDHEDALKWGVEQGFVDPANVCMSGASYGGYAGLQALVRNADLWKCVIAGLAPTDMYYQLTSRDGDTAGSTAGVELWKSIIGVKNLSEDLVREVSPLYAASKMRKPIFLYSGEDDLRVPLPQIVRMEKALAEVGNPVKAHVIKKHEGHGFGKVENNVDLYNQIFAFLKEQFGK